MAINEWATRTLKLNFADFLSTEVERHGESNRSMVGLARSNGSCGILRITGIWHFKRFLGILASLYLMSTGGSLANLWATQLGWDGPHLSQPND